MSARIRDLGALPDVAQAMGVQLHWRNPAGVEPTTGPGTQWALPATVEAPAESETDEARSRP